MKHLALIFLLFVAPCLAVAQQTTTQAFFPTEASIAGTSLTGSYQTLSSDTNAKKLVEILNNSNAAVIISFDGTNNHFTLPAYSSLSLDLGALGIHTGFATSIKHAGAAPTAGTIYFGAAYK